LRGKRAERPRTTTVSTKLQRIAKQAREAPDRAFTSLSHPIDIAWLYEAYRRTRKDGAVGVDGQTARESEANLDRNLRSRIDRAKSRTYRAPPVRPTRTVGAPRALEVLWQQRMAMGGGRVVEVDMFDTIAHPHIRSLPSRRVRDGVWIGLIGRWLNAGVLEDGDLVFPDEGTPQGERHLATACEHRLARRDRRVVREGGRAPVAGAGPPCSLRRRHRDGVLPRGRCASGDGGSAEAIRQVRSDAAAGEDPPGRVPPAGGGDPGDVRLSGVHARLEAVAAWEWWGVARETARGRLGRSLERTGRWLRRVRHWRIPDRHAAVVRKLRGHHEDHGMTGNSRAIGQFRREVKRLWRKWPGRRSWRAKSTSSSCQR